MTGAGNELFENTEIRRAVLRLAVPTVISQLITVVYNMADTFFIGQMNDPVRVAAATVSMPLFMFMTAIANLFGLGGASLISRSLGKGDRETAGKTCAFCVWGGITAAFVYGLAVYLSRSFLLPLLGAKGEVLTCAEQYVFWTVTVGAVPTMLNSALAHLVRAEGRSREASFGVALGGILNILLDPLFIFVLDLEILGAAVATMLSNTAAMLYFFALFYRMRKTTALTLSPRRVSLGREIVGEVLTVGLPGFVISLMGSVSNSALNHMISEYSEVAVAGMGIAKKINMMAFAIAQGMTQGSLPLIGYNFTSGNRKRMKDAIRTTSVFAIAVALCGTAFLFICASPLTGVFIGDAETVDCARGFLRIICAACPTTTVSFLVITVFQATGRRGRPLFLSFLRKGGLDVPLMLLFRSLAGMNGIAWATPVADTAAMLIALALLLPYLRALFGKNGEPVQ